MIETWRPVVGAECFYEVSDMGRVKRLPRVVRATTGDVRIYRERIVATPENGEGYPQARIFAVKRRAHHLVAEAFLGPRGNGDVVRHLNDVKTDNRLANLAYGTPSDNQRDSVRNGTHWLARRDACSSGHEYTDESTRITTLGKRACRICDRERAREKRARVEVRA